MPKKKSKIRSITKLVLLWVNVMVSVLILYPQFFQPLSFIWVNGFLRLMLPYLMLIEFLLIISWLVAKPILALIPIGTLMIGWQSLFVLFAWHPGGRFTPHKKAEYVRIASWNIKEFNGNESNLSQHKLRTEEIAYSIQKWNPDIICLQEYNTKELLGDPANHATYFTKKYPYYFFSKDYTTKEPGYYAGCIIFSRYPIVDAKRIPFINGESLIYTTLLRGDDTIRVYTTHLASYRFKENDFEPQQNSKEALALKTNWNVVKKMKAAFVERAIQANLIQTQLASSPYPSIITGDFNDVPSSYTYNTIKANWQDAFLKKGLGIGATYLGISPTLRIDYILPNQQWEVKGWESIDENLSDHHMILSDLLLLKK